MGLTGSQQQQLPNQAQTPKDKKKKQVKGNHQRKKRRTLMRRERDILLPLTAGIKKCCIIENDRTEFRFNRNRNE